MCTSQTNAFFELRPLSSVRTKQGFMDGRDGISAMYSDQSYMEGYNMGFEVKDEWKKICEEKGGKESKEDRLQKLFEIKSDDEKMVSAQVGLVMDMQFAIQAAMKKHNISREELAKRMGCEVSDISKMMEDGANPRIETIARALTAMDEGFLFASQALHGDIVSQKNK